MFRPFKSSLPCLILSWCHSYLLFHHFIAYPIQSCMTIHPVNHSHFLYHHHFPFSLIGFLSCSTAVAVVHFCNPTSIWWLMWSSVSPGTGIIEPKYQNFSTLGIAISPILTSSSVSPSLLLNLDSKYLVFDLPNLKPFGASDENHKFWNLDWNNQSYISLVHIKNKKHT